MLKQTRKAYAATVNARTAGVFFDPEKAPAEALLQEIEVMHLEGSPESGEYVCMAKGIWNTVCCEDGSFFSEEIEVGPVWGDNAQSAAAALLGHNLARRGVVMTEFVLYEADRVCAEEAAKNLARDARFCGIVEALESGSGTAVSADYIGNYHSEIRKAAELEAKRRLTNVSETASRLVSLKDRERVGEGLVLKCSTGASDVRRFFEKELLCMFSTEELIRLAELLKGSEEKSLSEIADGCRDEEERKLLEAALECAPAGGMTRRL